MAVSEVVSPIHYTTAQHSMPDLRPELSQLLGVEMTDEQVEKLKLLFAQVQALPFPCNVCKQCPLSHFPRRLPTQQPSNPATQFQPPLLIPVGTAWYCMVYCTHFVVHYSLFVILPNSFGGLSESRSVKTLIYHLGVATSACSPHTPSPYDTL